MLTRPADEYHSDPTPSRVHTLLFATIPPDYLADRAKWFAEQGVEGVMLQGPMRNWSDDIWALPGGERIVGEENPRFRLYRRMNERCAEAGIRFNSVKVAFYKPLPDWFDDAGWRGLCENFRQCAIFARDSGFAGVALDIEYIAQIYDLDYEGYQAADYPRDRLREAAARRGAEIMEAMIREFPAMINWHLPEGISYYGPLATDLLVGMVRALARHDAPGGFHVCTEGTYTQTAPEQVVRSIASVDEAIAAACDENVRAYWLRKGTICPGLWPLGYYREICDADGEVLGYGGKKETFGDEVIGSYADKSENYPPEEFRRQYAAARMTARHSLWIYCHGSVLYRMTDEERERYGGGTSDALPTAKNLDEYLAVLRERPVFDDPAFAEMSEAVRSHRPVDLLAGRGLPRTWWHVGPFPNPEGKGLDVVYPPETRAVDLADTLESEGTVLSWRMEKVDASGFVNLRRIVSREDFRLSYSATRLESSTERKAFLRVGSDDSAKIWLNGKLVHRVDGVRGATEDEDTVVINLPAGRSSILIKCGNYTGGWGFYLRLSDAAGRELPGVRWAESA